MDSKIEIARLDINVDELIASTAKIKKELDEVKGKSKELGAAAKSGSDEAIAAQIANEVQVKSLTKAYNESVKAIAQKGQATLDEAQKEKLLTAATQGNIKSISEARSNLSVLTRLRNETNTSTQEGQVALVQLNAAIDKNNDYIKGNADGYLKLKINIGNYKEDMKAAIKESGLMNQVLGGFAEPARTVIAGFTAIKSGVEGVTSAYGTYQAAQENYAQLQQVSTEATNLASEATEKANKIGFQYAQGKATQAEVDFASSAAKEANAAATVAQTAATEGSILATNAATAATTVFGIALAAVGIGIIIAGIALLIGYFRKLDPVVDGIEQGLAGLGGIIDFLQGTIGEFVTSITSVGDLMSKLGDIIAHPIDSLSGLADGMEKAAIAAAALKEREQELGDQMVINSVLNKQQESDIKRLLIQAKDKSKSQEEQNKMYADAERLNREIFERNKKTANEELQLAYDKAAANKGLTAEEIESIKSLGIVRANALKENGRLRLEDFENIRKAIEANIEVENQASEQLDKIIAKRNNALEKQEAAREKAEAKRIADAKKLADAQTKILQDALKDQQAQLALLQQELGARARNADSQIELLEGVRDKKLEVAQAEYNASQKTAADGLKLDLARNSANMELLTARENFIIEAADREVEIFRNANAKQLEDGKVFNDELLAQKQALLDETARLEIEAQTKRLEAGQISELAYNDAVNVINQENEAAKEELKKEKEEAEIEKQLEDLDNKRAAQQENFDIDLEIERAQNDLKMKQELAAADKSGADKQLIKDKYAKIDQDLDKKVMDNKLSIASSTFGSIAALVGEQTAVGKAAAIAQATIDTYKGAVSAYSAMSGIPIVGPVLGAVAAAAVVSAGVINVKKIASTKAPKAKDGAILQGASHHFGGVKLYDGSGKQVIEAEGGEAIQILSRKDTAASHFNDFNAQVEKNVPTVSFATDGGALSQSINSGLDLTPVAGMVIDAVSNLPAPVVSVHDVIDAVDTQARVVSAGDLG